MNADLFGFRNANIRDAVAVSTSPVLLGTGAKRSAIQISNPHTSGPDVLLKFAKHGQAAPTISISDWHYPVYAGDLSPFLGISESVAVWAYAASGTTVNVVEMGY